MTPDSTAASASTWAHKTDPSFVEVDGLRTAYRRKGSGERVLFLHGSGLTRMWLPFYERLSEQVDLVVPEHPGFGDTPLPETLEGFDDVVLHYDALTAALELDDVHLVGHSLGGWMAAEIAVFYPRRFKSLTLLTAAGLHVAGAAAPDPFRMEPEEAMAALLNGRADRYQEYFVQEGFPEDAVQAFSEATADARLTWNPRYDRKLDRRLARVATPTLVLGAEDDRMVPTATAARYAELIPGARLVTVAGEPGEPSGHLVHLEQPERVAQLVAAHVAAHA